MHSTNFQEYLLPCCQIVRDASALIMKYYRSNSNARQKEDNSPVTDADIAANRMIVEALTALTPHIAVIAEEDEKLPEDRKEWFWLVDPLDGTRSFVRGEPEFTVNIGLIHKGRPVLGVISAPAQNLLYYGSLNMGATRIRGDLAPEIITVRVPPTAGVTVVRSQSHPSARTNEYLQTLKIDTLISGSSSIKFCRIAEGSADIYPRFGRTMEWDTAAGHAILNAAGGRVETEDKNILTYGKPGFENPAFIAFGK
jgi:3'(2'), 5'-bisphosphate nucleotidase